MRKGGYKIIDLHDTNFTEGTAATVDGIYDSIEGSYRKPILLSGLKVGGVEYPDTFGEMSVDSGAYNSEAYSFTIKIESNDAVTVSKKN